MHSQYPIWLNSFNGLLFLFPINQEAVLVMQHLAINHCLHYILCYNDKYIYTLFENCNKGFFTSGQQWSPLYIRTCFSLRIVTASLIRPVARLSSGTTLIRVLTTRKNKSILSNIHHISSRENNERINPFRSLKLIL